MTNDSYIRQHREDDVRRLALAPFPEGTDSKWCLQQIEGWQLARRKLPRWASTEGLWFPPRLSLEQCSSEQTAAYKQALVERLIPTGERESMADLTGGLGVDFSFLAPLFRRAHYMEVLPHLRQLAKHNMPLLGLPHAQITPPLPLKPVTLLFLDPARRDDVGRKTIAIDDCTPNLLASQPADASSLPDSSSPRQWQDELLAHSRWLLVKLSPMLDIRQAIRQLHGVCEVHVVSVQGECKELLFVCSREKRDDLAVTYHCVNLGVEQGILIGRPDSLDVPLESGCLAETATLPSLFLYEPNASVLKAGMQDVLCRHYPLRKLHPNSHLFVSETLIPRFPGRTFRIVGWSDFGKKHLKNFLGDLHQANLTVRNFPTPVAALRRQLHLAEGGDTYLFATTLADGSHLLIRGIKV